MENQIPQQTEMQNIPFVPQITSHRPSKTFITLVVAILLIGVGLGTYFLGTSNNQQHPTVQVVPTTTLTPSPTTDPTANWKTYTNMQYNFMFDYPPDFTIIKATSEYFPPYNLSNLIVLVNKKGLHITTPQYLEDANFSISNSTDTSNCYSFNKKILTNKNTINGTTYYVSEWDAIEAGHVIGGSIYRTIKNYSCFEISAVIESQNPEDPGLDIFQSQLDFDFKQLVSELDQTLSTFKFTTQNNSVNVLNISNLQNFPLYSNAIFVKEDIYPACNDVQSSQPCDLSLYTWTTTDSFEKVSSFYTNKVNMANSGWNCNGGSGSYQNSQDAQSSVRCTNNSNRFFYLDLQSTSNGTRIDLRIYKNGQLLPGN